jgi:transposase-like protein
VRWRGLKVEVITGPERRRRWSAEQKRAIVAASLAPGAVVTEIARRAEICPGQIYRWRREIGVGNGFTQVLIAPVGDGAGCPATPADWVGACAASLAPLIELIRRHALAAERLQGDDTTVPVQTKHFAHLAHGCPLYWRPLPHAKAKGADPNRASRGATYRGENQPGMVGEIILERRAKSNRNGGRHHRGFTGDFPRNLHQPPPITSVSRMPKVDWKYLCHPSDRFL